MTEPETDLTVPGTAPAHAKRLFRSGVAASTIYVAGLLIYAAAVRGAMLEMTPDAFATFLSGVFAPLAFLWLVLGFRQQGDELQNSARALWLQGEELRNSVEQQRQLVEVSREQLSAEHAERVRAEADADRAAQPRFVMPGGGGSYSGPRRTLTLEVVSAGPTCSDVQLLVDNVLKTTRGVLPATERIATQLEYESPDAVAPIELKIVYTDQRGNRRSQSFAVPVDENGGPNKDRTLGSPIKLPGIGTAQS